FTLTPLPSPYTLPLHDALPISNFNLSLFLKDPAAATGEPQTLAQEVDRSVKSLDSKLTIPMDMATEFMTQIAKLEGYGEEDAGKDRKSTRLNSSHVKISYAVFC